MSHDNAPPQLTIENQQSIISKLEIDEDEGLYKQPPPPVPLIKRQSTHLEQISAPYEPDLIKQLFKNPSFVDDGSVQRSEIILPNFLIKPNPIRPGVQQFSQSEFIERTINGILSLQALPSRNSSIIQSTSQQTRPQRTLEVQSVLQNKPEVNLQAKKEVQNEGRITRSTYTQPKQEVSPVAKPIMERSRSRNQQQQQKIQTPARVEFPEDKEYRPCTCTKTKCLKMYCWCFHNGRHCTKECKCESCKNLAEFQSDIEAAKEHVEKKAVRTHHPMKDDLYNTKKVDTCNCKNSRCLKGYCECFIRGQKCSQRCSCEDCENGRDEDTNFMNLAFGNGTRRRRRKRLQQK